MTHRSTTRRIRIRRRRVAALVIVIATIAAALGDHLPASSSPRAAPSVDVPRSEHRSALDPALLGALRRAEADAPCGVEIVVESGWRSPEHQAQLLREAVSKYGSQEEAARWVASPETSPHVSGDAVDIGPPDAAAWLSAARHCVRAVPDLRQRTVALRTAPRSRRSRLPADVRRPDARPKDAPVKRRVAFAMVALTLAGCSNEPAESGNTSTHQSK